MDFEVLSRQLVRTLRGPRSQAAMSRRLRYKTNAVYTWEAGLRFPSASTFLRAATAMGVDAAGALRRFLPGPPDWSRGVDPTAPDGVARFLDALAGGTPVVALSRRAGRSRFAVARWLRGLGEPRLPDFLRLVEAASLRLLDLVALFADPNALPEVAAHWRALEAHRRSAYDLPWTPAVLRALELEAYRAGAHEDGWIARRLGIDPADEAKSLEALDASGEIRREGERWVPERVMTVDVRHDPDAERRLKAHWARVGVARLERGAPGSFSFNVFGVSAADLERIRELLLEYYERMRSIVADSKPVERVAVANLQVFALDVAEPPRTRR